MADVFKPLGQVLPAAGVLTDAYVVPAGKAATVSSFVVNNQSGTPTTFAISLAIAGAADTPAQYLYGGGSPDAPIDGTATVVATIGVTCAAGDVLRVRSGNGQVAFNLAGLEVN